MLKIFVGGWNKGVNKLFFLKNKVLKRKLIIIIKRNVIDLCWGNFSNYN